jgi:hypothetical protein
MERMGLIHWGGMHQIELIVSVLLRNAHYPVHWESSKDSMCGNWTSQSEIKGKALILKPFSQKGLLIFLHDHAAEFWDLHRYWILFFKKSFLHYLMV